MPEKARSEVWTGPNAGVPEGVPVPPTAEALARTMRLEEAKRIRVGGVARRPGRGDGWRLTSDDERLLAAASRFGVVTWRQASAWFYKGVYSTSAKRIGYLREAGLIRQFRDDEWAGRVLMPTAAGTTLVREELPIPIAAPQQHPGERLLHRLAVTDAGLRFEARGDVVITEREVRTMEGQRGLAERYAASLGVAGLKPAKDGRGIDRWFCAPVGSAGSVHYPDLVVVTAKGLVAIEVEVTVKPVSRLREIMRGYRDSGLFTQVIYFTTAQVGALLHGWREPEGQWAPGVLQQLSLLPEGPPEYGAGSRVRVQQFVPRDPGVAYRLDMRQMPPSWKVNRAEWTALREKWEADTEAGRDAKVPFLRWWRDIEMPRQQLALLG